MGSASALDSLNCTVSGASSGCGDGRTVKDALLARETVEECAGRPLFGEDTKPCALTVSQQTGSWAIFGSDYV